MISVSEDRLDDVLVLLHQVPELDEALPSAADIMIRIKDVPHSILTAYVDGAPAGFKIGYEREGRFYSWLGGVVPAMRQHGVAKHLAEYQEVWAKAQGYTQIWMKTRNRFPAMLLMAVRRGFRIIRIEPRDDLREHRIVLEKSL